MIKKYHTTVLLLSFLFVITSNFVIVPNVAAASGECEVAIISESVCQGGIPGLILLLINILTGGVGIVAVGGIVYAALLYTTAGAEEAQVKKAKETIRNVSLGLVLFVVMWSLTQYLIPGGAFGRDLATPGPRPGPADTSGGQNSGGSNGSPEDSNEKKVDTRLTIGFQNLGYVNVSADNVFQTIRGTLDTSDGNNVYGFAEIDAGDAAHSESAALKRVFGPDGWSGANKQVPIISQLKDNLVVTGSQEILLHDATGNNTGPARWLIVKKIKNINHKNTKLAVLNTHFVSKAYNDPPYDTRLQQFWDQAFEKTSETIKALHDDGYDIVMSGDFNNTNVSFSNVGMRKIAQHGPDRIFSLPAKGRSLDVASSGDFFTPSGESFHDCLFAKVIFSGDGVR